MANLLERTLLQLPINSRDAERYVELFHATNIQRPHDLRQVTEPFLDQVGIEKELHRSRLVRLSSRAKNAVKKYDIFISTLPEDGGSDDVVVNVISKYTSVAFSSENDFKYAVNSKLFLAIVSGQYFKQSIRVFEMVKAHQAGTELLVVYVISDDCQEKVMPTYQDFAIIQHPSISERDTVEAFHWFVRSEPLEYHVNAPGETTRAELESILQRVGRLLASQVVPNEVSPEQVQAELDRALASPNRREALAEFLRVNSEITSYAVATNLLSFLVESDEGFLETYDYCTQAICGAVVQCLREFGTGFPNIAQLGCSVLVRLACDGLSREFIGSLDVAPVMVQIIQTYVKEEDDGICKVAFRAVAVLCAGPCPIDDLVRPEMVDSILNCLLNSMLVSSGLVESGARLLAVLSKSRVCLVAIRKATKSVIDLLDLFGDTSLTVCAHVLETLQNANPIEAFPGIFPKTGPAASQLATTYDALVKSGLVEPLMKAFRTFGLDEEDASVCRHAAVLLYGVSLTPKGNKDLSQKDFLHLLVKAMMQQNVRDIDSAVFLSFAAGNLRSEFDPSLRSAFLVALKMFLAMCTYHEPALQVTQSVLACLARAAYDTAFHPFVARCDGICQMVVAVLRKYGLWSLDFAVCGAITLIGLGETMREELVSYGVLDVLVAMCRAFGAVENKSGHDETKPYSNVPILNAITDFEEKYAKEYIEAGICEAIAACMQQIVTKCDQTCHRLVVLLLRLCNDDNVDAPLCFLRAGGVPGLFSLMGRETNSEFKERLFHFIAIFHRYEEGPPALARLGLQQRFREFLAGDNESIKRLVVIVSLRTVEPDADLAQALAEHIGVKLIPALRDSLLVQLREYIMLLMRLTTSSQRNREAFIRAGGCVGLVQLLATFGQSDNEIATNSCGVFIMCAKESSGREILGRLRSLLSAVENCLENPFKLEALGVARIMYIQKLLE